MSDLQFTIGADDTAFRNALKNSETLANRTASRMSQVIKSQTQGYRQLVEAGRTPLVMGAAVVGTLAVITRVYDSLAGASDRAAAVFARQRQEAQATADAVRGMVQNFERLRSGDGEDMLSGVRATLLEQQALQRRLQAEMEQAQREQRANTGVRGFVNDLPRLGFPDENGLTRIDRAALARERELDAAERLRVVDEQGLKVHEIRSKIIERAAQDMQRSASIALLESQGLDFEARVLRERQHHEEQLKRMGEIRRYHEAAGRTLEAVERQRHAFTMHRLREAENLRKRQEAETAQRHQEDYQRQLDTLKVESMRLTKQDQAAKELERRVEHERNMQEIRRREGITDQQRERLLESERMNFYLRQQADARSLIESQPAPRVVSGFLGAEAVARRVLGPGPTDMSKLAAGVAHVVSLVTKVERHLAASPGGSVELVVVD